MSTIVIKGREVASRINVIGEEQVYSKGPNTGKPYFRARCDGRGFTVTPEFFQAWKEGQIAEVSLSESTYDVEDPMTPGETIKRDSYQLNAYATMTQLNNIIKNELEMERIEKVGRKKIELSMQALEVEALGELKISDKLMEKLKVAIEA